MIKPLIIGTSYIGEDGAQKYGSRVVEMWAKLAIELNHGIDICLIDSHSPTNPADFLKKFRFTICLMQTANDPPPRYEKYIRDRTVLCFPDNIGHLNVTGRDGFGRAFCKGIEIADLSGYTHVAYMDADIIMARPVMPIIERMAKSDVKVACPMDHTYYFIENGIMFYDVKYMIESKFVERYDWPNRKRNNNPMDIPEIVFEKLLEDDLFILPLRGLRDDHDRLTVNNVTTAFPYGLDYLTHVKDIAVYERFLDSKGIKL